MVRRLIQLGRNGFEMTWSNEEICKSSTRGVEELDEVR
jgi:hypothetical protein